MPNPKKKKKWRINDITSLKCIRSGTFECCPHIGRLAVSPKEVRWISLASPWFTTNDAEQRWANTRFAWIIYCNKLLYQQHCDSNTVILRKRRADILLRLSKSSYLNVFRCKHYKSLKNTNHFLVSTILWILETPVKKYLDSGKFHETIVFRKVPRLFWSWFLAHFHLKKQHFCHGYWPTRQIIVTR